MIVDSKKVEKTNIKFIIILLLILGIVSVGVYYIYNKNKNTTSENGSAITGYVLSDGA